MIKQQTIRRGFNGKTFLWLICAILTPFFGNGQSQDSMQRNSAKKIAKDSIKAKFPGGQSAFRKYIMAHARYPLTPQLQGKTSAKIAAKFVVDTLGNVIQPEIRSKTDKAYNQEILRVLHSSPAWVPAVVKGKKTKMRFTQTVRFHFWGKNIAGANVLLHGTLLRRKDIAKKTTGLYLPVRAYDPKFSNALFGPSYRPLVIVDDIGITPAAHDRKGFKKTLRRLEQIDTSKFDLFIDENIYPFYVWKEHLHVDSISTIFINDSKRTANPEILGKVALIREAEVKKRVERRNKEKADKQEFNTYLRKYRAGEVSLRKELIYIDGIQYNSKSILAALDTSTIRRVSYTTEDVAKQKFKDSRGNGYFQLQSKWYHSSRNKMDLEKLVDLLRLYQGTGEVKENYIIYLNNTEQIDFQQLSLIPKTTIRKVVIISVEEAKAFFGQDQQCPIIYITMM